MLRSHRTELGDRKREVKVRVVGARKVTEREMFCLYFPLVLRTKVLFCSEAAAATPRARLEA